MDKYAISVADKSGHITVKWSVDKVKELHIERGSWRYVETLCWYDQSGREMDVSEKTST